MSKLLSSSLPPVSREFALELQRTFRPMTVTVGFDRDELMQSVGEQRVVDYILRKSIHKAGTMQNQEPVTEVQIEEAIKQIKKPKQNIWSLFTNQVS